MNELIKIENIEKKIYEIRWKKVILDSDLAELYHVETKRINEAVKNNSKKFPLRLSFIISNEEKEDLWSKFSTANISSKSRSNPRVFTEQGVSMLATILKSFIVTDVSLVIMDAFVNMRPYINYNKELLPNRVLLIESKVENNTLKIDKLFDMFNSREIVKDKELYLDRIIEKIKLMNH